MVSIDRRVQRYPVLFSCHLLPFPQHTVRLVQFQRRFQLQIRPCGLKIEPRSIRRTMGWSYPSISPSICWNCKNHWEYAFALDRFPFGNSNFGPSFLARFYPHMFPPKSALFPPINTFFLIHFGLEILHWEKGWEFKTEKENDTTN